LHEFEDASGFKGAADEFFAPRSEPELAEILARASRAQVPVTLAGAWTGLTGGSVPQGGWLVSLKNFDRIEIAAGLAVVGAGVSLEAVADASLPSKQFYAPDPTERTASIGGSIANNASGSRSFRYGSTRRHIQALRVVLMDGSVRAFRRGEPIDFVVPELAIPQTTKHTGGYELHPAMDWVDLFVGSEGTLGVVTEAELRLLPLPQDLISGIVFFHDDEEALSAVESWRSIQKLRMLEYFDADSLSLLRTRFSEVPESAGAALLIEEEGADIDPWVDRVQGESWFAMTDQDRERFRRFRHALPEMVNDIMRQRGFLKLGSDYAVPVPRNREMLAFYHEKLRQADSVIFGHIGDAHVHVNILPKSEAEFERGKELMLEFAKHAVALGGTVSAEHGLGKRKKHLLALQYTPEQIEAMREVKRRLDPQWLLGRGNLF
jgi:FAD/FMN-containing dehydrogenase